MCDRCDWEELVESVDGYLADSRFKWATEFLSKVRSTMMRMRHCTERQRGAVAQIRAAALRPRKKETRC